CIVRYVVFLSFLLVVISFGSLSFPTSLLLLVVVVVVVASPSSSPSSSSLLLACLLLPRSLLWILRCVVCTDFHVAVNQVLSLQFACANSSSVAGSHHVWSERCCVKSFQNFLASRCSEEGGG